MKQVIFKDDFNFDTQFEGEAVTVYGLASVNETESSIQTKINYAIIGGERVAADEMSTPMLRAFLKDFHQSRHEDTFEALGIEMTAEDHKYVEDLVATQLVNLVQTGGPRA